MKAVAAKHEKYVADEKQRVDKIAADQIAVHVAMSKQMTQAQLLEIRIKQIENTANMALATAKAAIK